MSALFEEQDAGVVEYAGEAVKFDDKGIQEIITHHESTALRKVEEILKEFGGKATGENVLHNNGDSIDHSQLGVIENINKL